MKCILLCRVSTEQQSLESQKAELVNMARRDGYAEEDIVSVENKESAVKLDEEERQGLNRMKELIETGEYDCVYVWELSRLSRRPKVLYSIKEYLQDRKIQLKIKEPCVALLQSNGEPDPGAELVFSLYATLSEQEGRNRKARFKRAKTAGALDGRYGGGPRVRFGYEVDENGYYRVNESEAETVRLIYRLYLSGYGRDRIFFELQDRGLAKSDGTPLSQKLIARILNSPALTGETVNEYGLDRRYPQILSKETWEAAQAQKAKNSFEKLGPDFDFRLCKHLIICPECGRHFVWWRRKNNQGSYSCVGKDVRKYGRNKPCDNSICVTDIWIESLALQQSVIREAHRMTKQNEDERIRVKENIKELSQKIAHCEKEISKAVSAMDRVSEMYFKGYINEEKMEDMNSRAAQTKKEKEESLRNLQNQMLNMREILEGMSNIEIKFQGMGKFQQQIYEWNPEKQYDLVHRHIDYIKVFDDSKPFPGKKNTTTKDGTYRARRIETTFKDGSVETVWFYGGLSSRLCHGTDGSLSSKCPNISPFTTERNGELENYIVLKLPER